MGMVPEVAVNPNYARMLKQLWEDANRWLVAANGHATAYNNPIGKLLGRKLAAEALDKYFKAIDDLLPKEEA